MLWLFAMVAAFCAGVIINVRYTTVLVASRDMLQFDVLSPTDITVQKRLALSVPEDAALSFHQIDNATLSTHLRKGEVIKTTDVRHKRANAAPIPPGFKVCAIRLDRAIQPFGVYLLEPRDEVSLFYQSEPDENGPQVLISESVTVFSKTVPLADAEYIIIGLVVSEADSEKLRNLGFDKKFIFDIPIESPADGSG